jgi:CubicO group peptidase (beta-lactamase class C family)
MISKAIAVLMRRCHYVGWLAVLAHFPVAAHTAEWPPNVSDPEVAILSPQYSDPVFWWRWSSRPASLVEPDPYFYWPVGVIAGAAGPFLPAAIPGRGTVSTEALEQAATWAQARKTYALIVVHKGRVQIERYWGERGDPNALTNGRAITRTVAHMLLGIAVGDGKLSLDDPIGRYLTEWKDDPRGAITVRQLAQNVSGLLVAPSLPVSQIYGNKDLCLAYCGDVVRAALDYPLTHSPGTRFEFAHENFQLVGILAERATGVPLPELMSERIWKRIGAQDGAFQLDRPNGNARVMCCMRATPRDWARLGMLVLNDGKFGTEQVLPAGWVQTMATPSARNPNYGVGLWLGNPYVSNRPYYEGRPGVIPQSEPFLADDVRMLEGGGFRVIFAIPSQDLMIIRLGEDVPDWNHAYLVNTIIRGIGRSKPRR